MNILTNENFLWSTNDTVPSIIINPQNSQMYNVIIYNEFCQIEDSIYITVKTVFCDTSKISIPNAFSPNNDEKNEYYRILDNDQIIKDFKLEIFNRFGQKVYSSKNIYEKWDGYFNHELLTPQVFHYYLEIICIGNSHFFKKGNITLIR